MWYNFFKFHLYTDENSYERKNNKKKNRKKTELSVRSNEVALLLSFYTFLSLFFFFFCSCRISWIFLEKLFFLLIFLLVFFEVDFFFNWEIFSHSEPFLELFFVWNFCRFFFFFFLKVKLILFLNLFYFFEVMWSFFSTIKCQYFLFRFNAYGYAYLCCNSFLRKSHFFFKRFLTFLDFFLWIIFSKLFLI